MDVLPLLGSEGLETSQPQGQAPPPAATAAPGQRIPVFFLGGQTAGPGWLWGKQKLPLCAKRKLECLWKPFFLSQPWLHQSILLGELVLKLVEGESRV